ncbi:MAG: hypothetical protein QM582_08405 [Micropruina sp.]|uniref:hypothetical protein n=1 Tax=Micropruina sp. TaxID=2737536 RepID=UPI0039E45C59
MPKIGVEDFLDNDTTQFVLNWNTWSTDVDRQDVYRRAWTKASNRSALAFISAVAAEKKARVPDHIVHYLSRHPEFSETFQKAFKKVRKNNWRLGAVVNQLVLEFPPSVSRAENTKEQIVMLYVVGDPEA